MAIGCTSAMFFGDRAEPGAHQHRAGPADRREVALLTWQPPPFNEWFREFTVALAAGRDLPASAAGRTGALHARRLPTSPGVVATEGRLHSTSRVEGMTAPMWFGHHTDDAYDPWLGLLGWMLEGLDDVGASSPRRACMPCCRLTSRAEASSSARRRGRSRQRRSRSRRSARRVRIPAMRTRLAIAHGRPPEATSPQASCRMMPRGRN